MNYAIEFSKFGGLVLGCVAADFLCKSQLKALAFLAFSET